MEMSFAAKDNWRSLSYSCIDVFYRILEQLSKVQITVSLSLNNPKMIIFCISYKNFRQSEIQTTLLSYRD